MTSPIAPSYGARRGGRTPETLGARLKRLRLERGLSQREISSNGVSYAYVSRIEADVRRPSVKAIRKLSERLGVSPEYLEYGIDGDPRELCEAQLCSIELALRLDDPAGLGEIETGELAEQSEQASDPALALRARLAQVRLALARGDSDGAASELSSIFAKRTEETLTDLTAATKMARLFLDAGHRHAATDLLYSVGDRALADQHQPRTSSEAGALFAALVAVLGLEQTGERFSALLAPVRGEDVPTRAASELRELSARAHSDGDVRSALGSARKAVAEVDSLDFQRELTDGLELCSKLLVSAGRMSEAEAIRVKAELMTGAIHPHI